jgi:hypothetical protein
MRRPLTGWFSWLLQALTRAYQKKPAEQGTLLSVINKKQTNK